MPAKRDWGAARAKVVDEGRCRSCGRTDRRLEAAHIIPRSRVNAGAGGEDPRNIVPLCSSPCHRDFDGRRLELLGRLTREEQTYIVSLVGLGEAYRRTTRRAA